MSIGLKSFKRNINAPYSSDVRVLACDTSGCGVQIFSSTGHKPGWLCGISPYIQPCISTLSSLSLQRPRLKDYYM